MTDKEVQEAFEQQTPVMFLTGRLDPWAGPYLVYSREYRWGAVAAGAREWLLSCGRWVAGHRLRPATPHELLTADGGTP